ncbi:MULTISPECIES: hypothetical protein [Enterobacter]|uniref:hypothetical protein n=1 Tax=Enterobacter TaxID=547 RepID=UPI000FEC1EA3|nr:hypothetical protein [Enterobacter sp.]MDU7343834.1 hypothetical protein [Enterobacter sp.]
MGSPVILVGLAAHHHSGRIVLRLAVMVAQVHPRRITPLTLCLAVRVGWGLAETLTLTDNQALWLLCRL